MSKIGLRAQQGIFNCVDATLIGCNGGVACHIHLGQTARSKCVDENTMLTKTLTRLSASIVPVNHSLETDRSTLFSSIQRLPARKEPLLRELEEVSPEIDVERAKNSRKFLPPA